LSEGRKTETEPQSTKKKTMKTTKDKKTKSGLLSRPEPLSTGTRMPINLALRRTNRSLATEELLALLRSEKPGFFALAEVVGQWVWIQFTDKQPNEVTRVLAELGFHWNKTRQSWQHPCGLFRDKASRVDPRTKYRCYPANTLKAA
jgi:hypothetical protein